MKTLNSLTLKFKACISINPLKCSTTSCRNLIKFAGEDLQSQIQVERSCPRKFPVMFSIFLYHCFVIYRNRSTEKSVRKFKHNWTIFDDVATEFNFCHLSSLFIKKCFNSLIMEVIFQFVLILTVSLKWFQRYSKTCMISLSELKFFLFEDNLFPFTLRAPVSNSTATKTEDLKIETVLQRKFYWKM